MTSKVLLPSSPTRTSRSGTSHGTNSSKSPTKKKSTSSCVTPAGVVEDNNNKKTTTTTTTTTTSTTTSVTPTTTTTYVYVRSDSVPPVYLENFRSSTSSSSNNNNVDDSADQVVWLPVVQVHHDIKNQTATVKVPMYSKKGGGGGGDMLFDCTGQTIQLQQQQHHNNKNKKQQHSSLSMNNKTSSNNNNSIKFHENHVLVDLKDYDNHILPMQNVNASGNGYLMDHPDMIQLPYMNEAAILYNLKYRHVQSKPYTRSGDMMIAMNPYQWYPDLYTTKQQEYYTERLLYNNNTNKNNNNTNKPEQQPSAVAAATDPRTTMEPHVYEVSGLAYKGLLGSYDQMEDGIKNQSILVSGESGAGKTETVKICLNHIATIATTKNNRTTSTGSNNYNPIVQKIIESNPLLEAFGNAKTRRNDNSSRFGKYLQLQFTSQPPTTTTTTTTGGYPCELLGSVCDVYLLEKNRIVQHHSGERNFHIFYQLLAAGSVSSTKTTATTSKTYEWVGEYLKNKTTVQSYKYLGTSTTSMIEGMSDADRFIQTMECLELIGVTDSTLKALVQVLCTVLQLGNLVFIPNQKNHDHDQAQIGSQTDLNVVSENMGVPPASLNQCLLERTFQTNKEQHKVPLSVKQAFEACDALAKDVYEKTFLWLVDTINTATSADQNTDNNDIRTSSCSKDYRYIGLLDIFGFESFGVNGFEQLCINYANEKLQQKFNRDIFENVQKEYEFEGINLADIMYEDNTNVIELIENKQYGLLSLLNEECVRPKGNDFDFVQKAIQINHSSTKNKKHKSCTTKTNTTEQQGKTPSSCLLKNKMDRLSFGIHHYAGVVMYHGTHFVMKNLDTLPIDIQDCMNQSTNPIIMKSNQRSNTSSSGKNSNKCIINAPTIWTKYRTQLNTLMNHLNATQSRYVRCIKPNNRKQPHVLEHGPVIEQLRCAGVVAAITISRSSFPNRLPNISVLTRYNNNNDTGRVYSSSSTEEERATICRSVLDKLLKCKEEQVNGKNIKAYVVGKTKTYFRAGALEYLEANRSYKLDGHVITIQRMVRQWLQYQRQMNTHKKVRYDDNERLARIEMEEKNKKDKLRKEQEFKKVHNMKLQELEEKIKQLEADMKQEDEQTKVALTQITKQCGTIENSIKDMGSQNTELIEEQYEERVREKARQEKVIEKASKLIMVLKKENTKLRTKKEKKTTKLQTVTDQEKKVKGAHETLTNQCEKWNETTNVSEGQYQTIKEVHDEMHTKNQKIIGEINSVTDSYTITAHDRQAYQKSMVSLLCSIDDQWRGSSKSQNRKIQQEIMKIAHDAERAWKLEMELLKIQTEGAELDHYSNHGVTKL